MLTAGKHKIMARVTEVASQGKEIALQIHAHPELGHEELKAVAWLTDYLAANGFAIEQGVGGLATAFKAVITKGKGPVIAFLAEYDALPELGHACGHNLIGVASCMAAIGLTAGLDTYQGTIMVIGTPAEERSGGKVTMVDGGVFEGIDACMMIHPADRYVINTTSLAMEAVEFNYYGRPSHAAAAPHKGRNALEGVIQLFNNINSLRSQLKDGVRINGIITEGGKAPNIIPDFAQAQFYIRAQTASYLKEVLSRVKACAEAAALGTGTTVTSRNFELGYANMISNEPLARTFAHNLRCLGVTEVLDHKGGMGSLDMGNVSQRVPAIHPFFKIGPKGLVAHTGEFCQASASEAGLEAMVLGAQALAMTGFDLLSQPKLLRDVKRSFNEQKK